YAEIYHGFTCAFQRIGNPYFFSFSFYKGVYFVDFVCFPFAYNRFCNSTCNDNNTFKYCCGRNRQYPCNTAYAKSFFGKRYNLFIDIRAVCTVGIMFYESFTTSLTTILLLLVFVVPFLTVSVPLQKRHNIPSLTL